MNGNLIIYGGTYEAGITAMKKKKVSEFSWKKLQTAIGTAVELGVNIAKYATGISTAEAGYQDVLKQVANTESGKANPEPLKTDEAQKNQPDGKSSSRNLSVSEKAAEKDSQIAKGETRGTPEGENTADSEGKAKDDKNTRVAKAKNEVVNAAVNKDGINGMVEEGLDLVTQIAKMCGTKSYPPISDTIMGTVVRVGTSGTFASYGGTYIGYGSTPDTRNAVVEVLVVPGSEWTWDHNKMNGGKAYIYDGDFKADAGANVFNLCSGIEKAEYVSSGHFNMYGSNVYGNYGTRITYDEHYGVQELFYQNQNKLEKGTIKDGTVYDEKGHEIVPEPIHTANIQVRGGTFHCHYNVMNAARLEKDAPERDDDGKGDHSRKFPGTSGMVNLGVDSFGEDLIRDGRIQIVDNSAGCLVLMDDRQVGDKGLYHYRLYCGDNELRTKSNLKVYPNNNAQANASYSMQLATYYGKGIQTNYIFTEDKKGDNIRSPYRQTENCFDFQLDAKNRSAYSVKPNFRNTETGELDVFGEKTSASEVWYYPAPLDYNGNPIGDIPKDKDGKPLSDSAYGYTALHYFGEESDLTKIVGSEQMNMVYQGYMPGRGSNYYYLIDRDLLDDSRTIFTKKAPQDGSATEPIRPM